MNGSELWPLLVPLAGLILLSGTWWMFRMGREVQTARARESFRLQAERLEGVVLKAATSTGKPRGLRWVSCRFTGEYLLVREKATRKLAALIPMTVQFEPIPDSDMEGVEAAKEPRQATAVMHFRRGAWQSDGRTLFNMTPEDALRLHEKEYILVGHHDIPR